jgi:RNA polymerase sigma factor (sigma-70 family)
MSVNTGGLAIDVAVLYRVERAGIENYFRRRVRDSETARDLANDTYLHAFTSRDRFTGDARDAGRWLYGIARHVLSDYCRRAGNADAVLRRVPIERDTDGGDEHDQILRAATCTQLHDSLAAAMRRLSAGQRAALTLRVIDELPYEEIASRLDVNPQLARAHVSRALSTLEASLAQAKQSAIL